MAILSGQLWKLNPEDFSFTSGHLNYHFSPRSALLFYYVFQFSIGQVQQAAVDFNQMKSPITVGFRLPRAFYDTFGNVWNRWYFDYFVHFQGEPPFFEASKLLGRAILQGMVLFDHLNIDMFRLLSYLNGLRNHEYFCMLMHMPSTHETLKMVLAGQVDSQTPAPLLIKAPRARLWTLLVTDLRVNFGKLSLQAGRLCGKHVWTTFPYWRQPNPTVTLEDTTLHKDFNSNSCELQYTVLCSRERAKNALFSHLHAKYFDVLWLKTGPSVL